MREATAGAHGGQTVRIRLSDDMFALIDAGDYGAVSSFHWRVESNRGFAWYAVAHTPRINGRTSKVRMHRLILRAPANAVVDHINGDGLDNRRSNLRLCTQTENTWNRRTKHGVSRFMGVSLDTRCRAKKWRATIGVHGKYISLGYFLTEEEAAAAYDEAAREWHGEFARLNFAQAMSLG